MIKKSFLKNKPCLLVVFFLSSFFFCYNANAAMISSDSLYKMSLQSGLRVCFDKYAKDEISLLAAKSYRDFFNTNGDWGKDTSQDVWITTHIGNSLKSTHSDSWERDSNLSCEQLFEGYSGQGEAKGLLQLFQFPAITSSTMAAWGYMPKDNGATPPSGGSGDDGNRIKITIGEVKDEKGTNGNPITTSGEIICDGIRNIVEKTGKEYGWIPNCEGKIEAFYRGYKIYTMKATLARRRWYTVTWWYQVGETEFIGGAVDDHEQYLIVPECDGDSYNEENCPSFDEGAYNGGHDNLRLALNTLMNMETDKGFKEAFESSNFMSTLWRLTYLTFKTEYDEPAFRIVVESVKKSDGGDTGGGDGIVTNFKPILLKKTAGEILAYNLNFDESLPNTGEIAITSGDKRYTYKQYVWDSTSKYSLYYRYLANMISLFPEINMNTCSEEKPTSGYYFKNTIKQWCKINIPGSLINVSVGDSILKYTLSTAEDSRYQLGKGNFEQVLEWFKKETSYEGIPEDAYARGQVGDDGELPPVDPDPGGGGGSGSSDACHTNSGSLGWIVCPVMNWLHKTLISLYNEAVEPMLQVDGRLLSNSATEEAWKIFRDIANIMFVILFLVVIISQLTGVGIDNYGIKKILPKMIVAAVLINLSYVICQLAVDISNIAGAGINGLLTDQAGNIVTSQSFGHSGVTAHVSGSFNASVMFETLLEVFMGALAVGGALGVIMTVMGSGVLSGLILPLLMGLITAFVAVLFFFALLGMRQAGVVILVVVSPVAFACYMLPNTKKLFDKWLKIFEGLLIVYPICGLLVGGSTFTSAILVSGTDSFFMWFIGMLLMVVPFFFIPTLLKGSFAAMGGIGAKISGLGKRFGKGLSAKTDKAVRSSDTYRRLDNFAGRHSISRKRRAAAVSSTAEYKKEMGARKRLSDRGNMKTRIAAIEAAEDAKATDEATSQRLSLMMSSGEGGGITMADGSKATYTLDNAERRTRELETKSRTSALTSEEQLELSALARGMSSMKGGAGRLGRIIRDSQDASGTGANTNFMSAMGEIYARDSIVQSKMNEKDMGASVYTEHFMPGGDGLSNARTGAAPTFTQTHGTYSGTTDYRGAVSGRVKSYAAGLNQGGAAVGEYIESLTEQDCQAIMDDEKLLTSLDTDVRQQFLDYAAGRTSTTIKNGRPTYDYSSAHTGWSVTEPRAKNVQFRDGSKEMQALGNIENSSERVAVNTERTANGIDDVNSQLQRHTRASMDAAATTLDNETLMEIATNPQAKMDDPLREAAEREAKRRIQDGKMNP